MNKRKIAIATLLLVINLSTLFAQKKQFEEYPVQSDTSIIYLDLETSLGKVNAINPTYSKDTLPFLNAFNFNIDLPKKEFNIAYQLVQRENKGHFYRVLIEGLHFQNDPQPLNLNQLKLTGDYSLSAEDTTNLFDAFNTKKNNITLDFEPNQVEEYTGNLKITLVTKLYGTIKARNDVECGGPCPDFKKTYYFMGIGASLGAMSLGAVYWRQKQTFFDQYKAQITEADADTFYEEANKNHRRSAYYFQAGSAALVISGVLLWLRYDKRKKQRDYYSKVCEKPNCNNKKRKRTKKKDLSFQPFFEPLYHSIDNIAGLRIIQHF